MSRFDIRTRTGLISTIIQGSMGSYTDADALAFFARVTAAGGTLTLTEQNAVNQLVLDLKSNSLWTSMLALYPMVGASAAACSQNLKSSSYTSTFSGGWTYASTGVTGNGTSGYVNTGLNLSTAFTLYNVHYSLYCRNNTTNGIDIGVTDSASTYTKEGYVCIRDSSNNIGAGFYDNANTANGGAIVATNTNSQGFYISSALASNNIFLTKGSSVIGTFTGTNASLPANGNIYYGAINNVTSTTAIAFSDRQYALASIGNGLSTTQASNFYTIVQAFQTSLSRNI